MKIKQRLKGRPRLNRPWIDKGTQELQCKRKSLLGNGNRVDTYLAESLLGILYAHDLISKSLYEAGQFFGELGYQYEPYLGHTFQARSSVLVLKRGKGTESSDRREERKTKAWRRALKTLKQSGPLPYKTVLKVVFYREDLYTRPLPPTLLREVQPLRKGLECLDVYFRRGALSLKKSSATLQDKKDTPCDRGLNRGRSTSSRQILKEDPPFFPSEHRG